MPFDLLFSLGTDLIKRIFPNAEDQAKAQLEFAKMQQDGQLAEIQARYAAIQTEAQPASWFTSGARPSFIWAVSLYFLLAPFVGILAIFNPQGAQQLGAGMAAYLSAIPDSVLGLFGTCLLGYSVSRSWEKITTIKQAKPKP
ncbi:3TM-type holin [Candidatus Cyanaurora vandensis]|uniref:3TM-type holin n=1 Tax=Candidatus Cyanaurora vandensis TaxID=2714958 RepID=UPI00257D4826|nr:3TM-type holin [Candidatus Cyanaurora vandensis]